MNFNKVLIGIPALNEEKHISNLIKEANQFGDVCVFDDGSTDSTVKTAKDSGAFVITEYPPINRGYGFALQSLFARARNGYDVLITLDGDGQHDPSEIPRFLEALCDSDVVVGNRFRGKSDVPLYRKKFIQSMNPFIGVDDCQCGFRAYNKKAIDKIRFEQKGFSASLEILQNANDRNLIISEVPCTISYENTKHSLNPLQHGAVLIERLFWGTIWGKPFTTLGIPATLFFIVSLFFGGWTLYFYSRSQDFVFSYALLSIGSGLIWLILSVGCIFVKVSKRILKEVRMELQN